MLTQGTDFKCGIYLGIRVCKPQNSNAKNAILALQQQILDLVHNLPGIENPCAVAGNKDCTPDGDVGPGTSVLASQVGLACEELAPLPAGIAAVLHNVSPDFSNVTAIAPELANYFAQINANFTQLYKDYLNRVYGSGGKPTGEKSPLEKQIQGVVNDVFKEHSFWFWLAIGTLGAGALGLGIWAIRRHKSKPKTSTVKKRTTRSFPRTGVYRVSRIRR